MSEAVATATFEEFLAAEQDAQRRHEYVGSRVYLMAGGTERHVLAAGLLFETVAGGARPNKCRPFTANRLVRVPSGSAYYPDVMVSCGLATHRLYETDAGLIVEVLSPSTANVDRREKATAYAALPGLEILVLFDVEVPRAEVARLMEGGVVGWDVLGSGDAITTRFGVIDIEAIHAAVEAAATT